MDKYTRSKEKLDHHHAHHHAHHDKPQDHHPQDILSTRTKDKLDLHYTMRGLLPEWWAAWDPTLEKVSW